MRSRILNNVLEIFNFNAMLPQLMFAIACPKEEVPGHLFSRFSMYMKLYLECIKMQHVIWGNWALHAGPYTLPVSTRCVCTASRCSGDREGPDIQKRILVGVLEAFLEAFQWTASG